VYNDRIGNAYLIKMFYAVVSKDIFRY